MGLLRRAFLPVSLLVLMGAAVAGPLPVFLERPRAPLDLTDVVTVEAPTATPVHGEFLLTAVNLRRAVPADLVVALFDDDVAFVAVPRVLPPGQGDRAYFDEQREVFAGSAELAEAIGLEAAGYEALTGAGVRVTGVLPGSPAEGLLREGDVIVAVDGAAVDTGLDLVQAVTDPEEAGRERTIEVRRGDQRERVSLTPRPLTRDVPQLGVNTETVELAIALPFAVSVDGGRIGGPSAGLMIALTVFDVAAADDLARGRVIAGTGEIDVSGGVVPIGGLAAKVTAAARSGAEVFLVPESQAQEAAGAVPPGSDMQVVGVGTFADAVDALRAGTA